jgi:hypothetical protein
LGLDEVLNQYRAVDELKEDKSDVDKATGSLMGQIIVLDHRQDCERQGEEDSENLKGYQLWESLVYIASIAKAQSEVLQKNPNDHS